jgi:HlyD family secretion protein
MAFTDVVKTRPMLAGLAAGVIIVVGGGWLLFHRGPDPIPPRHDPPARVSALGRLEPAGDIINVSGPAGARIDRYDPAVRDGAKIKQGDVIAYLDTYPEALASRDQAASMLAEATRQREAEKEAGGAAVDDANLQVRRADRSLPLQIQAQEAELRRSTTELEWRKADLARAEKLRAGNAILQSQYDAVVSAEKQAEELVTRNKAVLAQLNEDHAIQQDASHAALRNAEAGRVRGELSARVDSLTAALRIAEARLDLARVKAPITGEVLEIITHPGEAIGNQPILKLGDTRTMVTVAEVYETDVRYVREGQKATITSRALAQPLTGRVEHIGTLIHKSDVLGIDPTAATDSRIIEVRIRLDQEGVAPRYNRHQVQVAIETGSGS